MITKRIAGRTDGRTSATAALRYGEGLKRHRATGEYLDKSHRTRLGNFGLVDDGIYTGRGIEEMVKVLDLAAAEMQANADLNTKVGADKKIAHFIFSFNQAKPSEAVLRDTEDSMLAALKLDTNHFATFLHNDNGYWHLHIFSSRIDKIKHLGNPLWQDKTIRDRVCKEIELRHGLERDNGLHRIDEAGQIVEVPREERRRKQALKSAITDKARATEIHSGEKTFQSWALAIRIGDRLRHARSWQDLHAAAGAYGCEIRQKGAGFIICPLGEKGGIQLSRVGMKNLTSKFGDFLPATQDGQRVNQVAAYKPGPSVEKGAGHYSAWRNAKQEFQPIKTERVQLLRQQHIAQRRELKEGHRTELNEIRARTTGDDRFAEISVAKMRQAIQLTALSDRFKRERSALYKDLDAQGPGNSFRDFLVREAQKGDNVALGLARKYGRDKATKVAREQEASQLRIRASITGNDFLPTLRLHFTHHVQPSGAIVYQLGHNRQITDSAVAKQILLNDTAACDSEAIATALRFATLKFGNTLSLTGPEKFQRLAVETAVRERLWVNFANPILETYRLKLIEQQHSTLTQRLKESHHASNYRVERLRQTPPARIRDRLHNMSLGDLVLDTSGDVMPLRPHVPHRLEQPKERDDRAMQRTAGRVEGTATDGRSGAHADVGSRKQVSVTTRSSAREWAEIWARENGKPVGKPKVDRTVVLTVLHMAEDGVVLDMGRSVAVFPPNVGQGIAVGTKVIVDQGHILLLQKSTREKGR